MDVYPSIDIRGGRVVRLSEGDYNRETAYGMEPEYAAAQFLASGASHLHVVDLDGARSGRPANFEPVARICDGFPSLFVEVGGGIRDMDAVSGYFDAGVKRVILGTAAITDFAFLKAAVARYKDAIAVGVDQRNGRVAVDGWTKSTNEDPWTFCEKLRDAGVCAVIYTDISKDGMLTGPNLEAYRSLTGIGIPYVTASGGVSRVEDVAELAKTGVDGVIIGKALYEGRVDLASAIAVASPRDMRGGAAIARVRN